MDTVLNANLAAPSVNTIVEEQLLPEALEIVSPSSIKFMSCNGPPAAHVRGLSSGFFQIPGFDAPTRLHTSAYSSAVASETSQSTVSSSAPSTHHMINGPQ